MAKYYQFMTTHQSDMKLLKPGVFCSSQEMTGDLESFLIMLENYCDSNKISMARICFHRNNSSPLMAMLIVNTNCYTYPAHRHAHKFESYFIIKGKCIFKRFNDEGESISEIVLVEGSFLLNESYTYHSLEPLTPVLAFIEHTTGPFIGSSNEYLPR